MCTASKLNQQLCKQWLDVEGMDCDVRGTRRSVRRETFARPCVLSIQPSAYYTRYSFRAANCKITLCRTSTFFVVANLTGACWEPLYFSFGFWYVFRQRAILFPNISGNFLLSRSRMCSKFNFAPSLKFVDFIACLFLSVFLRNKRKY